jgi:amino acid transporter
MRSVNKVKKVGDLLTALGVVGAIAVVLELIIGWKMIAQSIMLWFILGSIILIIVGVILRNSGKEKPDGRDMKQVGIAMLISGIGLLAITFGGMFSSDPQSTLAQFVDDRLIFLIIFGLVFLLLGIIFRSVGKSKTKKLSKDN